MDRLTNKEGNPITREKIDEIFYRISMDGLAEINHQFLFHYNELTEEEKNNPLMREVLAAHIAQINVVLAMKRILCELLGIEDTTAAGVAEDVQAKQSEQ